VVVHEAGQPRLAGAHAAAGLRRVLEDGDVDAPLGERARAHETVVSGADNQNAA
jgi:hypothetical protein